MKESKVYFINLTAKPGRGLLKKFENLLINAGIKKIFKERELVGIKVHFGEDGNTAYMRPEFSRIIVNLLNQINTLPFLTDSNTLYGGRRSNSVEHIKLAAEHGFNLLSVGAPVIISDGIRGLDFKEIEVNLKHFKKVKVASGVYHADGLVVFSHFKGHSSAGFGGVFKNIGMGTAPRPGKLEQHSNRIPFIKKDMCTGCGICIKYCPENAIILDDNRKAVIIENKCIGCGECIASCLFNAIMNQWDNTGKILIERIVEYTYGVWKLKKDKMLYINGLIDITPDCDCWNYSDTPVVEDIGFLASTDPVALEQASFDLVKKAEKIHSSQHYHKTKPDEIVFKSLTPEIDSEHYMEYAEKLKMGTRNYRLITIS